jgi:cytoskeleton protein RodZ
MAVRKRRAEDDTDEARGNVIDAPIVPRRISVSDSLRGRRVECGLEIAHVAQVLRIRAAVLIAIEEGNFDQLPGPTYAVGFVRSYATYLGLDAEALVQRFKAEATEVSHRPHLEFPLPIRDSRMPTGPLLVICVVLAGLIYAGWYYFNARPGQFADIVPAVPDRLHRLLNAADAPRPMVAAPPPAPAEPPAATAATPVQETATAPAPVQTAPVQTAPVQTATVPSPAPSVTANSPVPATDGVPPVESHTALPTAPAAAQPDVAQPAVAGDAAAPAPASSYGAPDGQARVVLHAVSDSWVQVRDKGGNLLFTRVLKPGEHYNVPNDPGLSLIAGNAGGLDVTVDGAPVPKLGEPGRVVRNVNLDPDHLLGPDHLPGSPTRAN